MMDKIKAFFFRDWTVEEKVLLLADVLLVGVLAGWLTSPFKGGLFSNNCICSTTAPRNDSESEELEEA